MKALFVGVLFVLVALVSGLTAQTLLADPEHVKPDHAAPPAAEVFGPSSELNGWETTRLVAEVEAVSVYLEAVEAERIERLAEEARIRAAEDNARQWVAPNTTSSSRVATGCTIILPSEIVARESGGDCDAYNATGCGGRGCSGYAQLDAGHFAAVSPWNPNVAGTCYGLGYDQCVEKLWSGGAGEGHWR